MIVVSCFAWIACSSSEDKHPSRSRAHDAAVESDANEAADAADPMDAAFADASSSDASRPDASTPAPSTKPRDGGGSPRPLLTATPRLCHVADVYGSNTHWCDVASI